MLHGIMFFPTCQMVLESITWPPSKQTDIDDTDDEISDGKVSLISGFLRTFVEEGTSSKTYKSKYTNI